MPGICLSVWRGCLPDALRVRQVAGVVVGRRDGQRVALGHRPDLLQKLRDVATFSEKALARSAYSGSSRRRWPYSFIVEPQPAALTTTLSRFSLSKVSMVLRAKFSDSSSRPAWVLRAPQQPWFLGATTSQPSAASTRTVAELTWEKKTCCTQPVRTPTRLRFSPTGSVSSGIFCSFCKLRHEGLHRPHARGEAAHDAGLAELVADAEALVEAQGSGGEAQALPVGEELEDHLSERLVVGAPLVAALDLRRASPR